MSDIGLGALVSSYLGEKHKKQEEQMQKAQALANQHVQAFQQQLQQQELEQRKADAAATQQRNWAVDTEKTRSDLVGEMQEEERITNEAKIADDKLKAAGELASTKANTAKINAENAYVTKLVNDGYDTKLVVPAVQKLFDEGDNSLIAALGPAPAQKARMDNTIAGTAQHVASVAEINARTYMTNLKAYLQKIDNQYEAQRKAAQVLGIQLDNKAKALKPDEMRAEITLKNAQAQAAMNNALIRTQLLELQKTHEQFEDALQTGKMAEHAQEHKEKLEHEVAAAVKAHSSAINKYNYLKALNDHPPDPKSNPEGFKDYVRLKAILPQQIEQSRQDINSYLQVEGGLRVLAAEAGVSLANGTTVTNPDGSINVEKTEANIEAAEKARADAKKKAANPPQIPPPKVTTAVVPGVRKITRTPKADTSKPPPGAHVLTFDPITGTFK